MIAKRMCRRRLVMVRIVSATSGSYVHSNGLPMQLERRLRRRNELKYGSHQPIQITEWIVEERRTVAVHCGDAFAIAT